MASTTNQMNHFIRRLYHLALNLEYGISSQEIRPNVYFIRLNEGGDMSTIWQEDPTGLVLDPDRSSYLMPAYCYRKPNGS